MLDHQTFNDAGLLRRYIVIHFHNTIVNGTSSLKVFERYLRLTKRLSKMTGTSIEAIRMDLKEDAEIFVA